MQAYSNLLCTNPGNAFAAAQYYGSAFGAGAMCLESTLVQSGV